MQWQYVPQMVPLVIIFLVGILIAFYAWGRRPAPGAREFALVMLAVALWSLGYALELSGVTLQAKVVASIVQYLGSAPLGVAWLSFALAYSGRQLLVRHRNLFLAMIVPSIIIILVVTNQWHNLIWEAIYIDNTGLLMAFSRGDLYWLNYAYNYLFLLAGTYILMRTFILSPHFYRRQAIALIVGLLLPWGANILYFIGIRPYPGLDMTPFAFTLTGVVLVWGLYRYQLLDVLPLARALVMENMSDAVTVLDRRDRIVDLNEAALQLIGCKPQEAIGQRLSTLVDQPDLFQQYREVLTAQSEITLGTKEDKHYYELQIAPVNQRDRLVGRLIVLHDITVRKQAQEELQEANERLNILRQVDAELNSRLDMQYVSTMAIDAAIRLIAADAGFIGLIEGEQVYVVQAIGRYPENFIGSHLPTNTGLAGRIIQQRKPLLVEDVSQEPDYTPLIFETHALILLPLISHRRFIGILWVETRHADRFSPERVEFLELLTSRIAGAIDNAYMFEERAQLIEELEAFAHTVAHDLKNPLGGIIGYAELLLMRSEKKLSFRERENVKMIYQIGHKMNDIIYALLLLSGVRTQEQVPIRSLNMARIVGDVQQRLTHMIAEYDAQVTAVGMQNCPAVLGYAPWVEEVWTNYLSNALKYGGHPPHVKLGATRESDQMVRLWVRDNGAGITLEDQAQLFTPFTRLSQAHSAEGHGLGLSIVQRIVEKLGGEVSVSSKIGEGSVFSFTLPIAPSSSS